MASTSTDSSRDYQDMVQATTPQPYPAPRRRTPPKLTRFYSSPLNESSDSTPLQVYGLEQREPSIAEKPKARRLQRVSYALDDIKEDFQSGQLNPRISATTEKLKRRTSTFIQDSRSSTSPPSSRPVTPVMSSSASTAPRSRPMSILSLDAWSSPPQREKLGRRLSSIGSFPRRKLGKPQEASISQPNLIGSSTQI